MAKQRGIYLGPRLRRLRRELGITQADMAADLDVSSSYIALMERNSRPITAEMLLNIAKTYRLELADLSPDDRDDHEARLTAALKDPIFADCDVGALEAGDVATNFPGMAEAMLRLYGAYRETQLALADTRDRPAGEGEAAALDPSTEARLFLASRRNHFPEIDSAAEQLAEEIQDGDLTALLSERHGIRVRSLPADVMGDSARRYDLHNNQLLLVDTLDRSSRRFQIATQIAYLEFGDAIDAAMRGGGFASADARILVRRALASYAAAALAMPYAEFAAAAKTVRYDVEMLARRFGTSFEQAAHRLTTLQRPGQAGVPFFFVRVDPAGNVSKRLDGAGFPFARHGGSCPLWSIHDSFQHPGRILTQWLELPDGERFFSITRTVTSGGGRYGAPSVTRAVALCCAADHASALVYADGTIPDPMPIGVACRICQRSDCLARAAPPIGRPLLSDENRRSPEPFTFADS